MKTTKLDLWQQFQRFYTEYPTAGLALDFSRMNFTDEFLGRMEPAMQRAYAGMKALEKGDIANPDENRMVGHYWLRNPAMAPTPAIRAEIESTLAAIKEFAADVHEGRISGTGGRFKNILVIGIGGSALGPQFVANALSSPGADKTSMFFFDNTDPDGMDKVLKTIGNSLSQTLCIVISKSGSTKETRNGMLEAKAAYEAAKLEFSRHAVAVTMAGSVLEQFAANWLARFPMWDWVGGRTSQLSAVGLLPAALQGLDIDALLAGAKACDIVTQNEDTPQNPAAMLSLAWFLAGNGHGEKCMVVLPYKDRLELFSKYLQQLIMESLGKELDLKGNRVNQGLTVFGNKGATDQHSYIQQLRDGLNNFFAVFIEVLQDRTGKSIQVEESITSGDFLHGFYLGTRQALYESGRKSITITVPSVSPFTVGALIALFERTVGLYASLINVNAYHQPGVQAGKVAADAILKLHCKVLTVLDAGKSSSMNVEQIGKKIGCEDEVESIFKICEHLAVNKGHGVEKIPGTAPCLSSYRKV